MEISTPNLERHMGGEHLRNELEQAQVSLEDMEHRLTTLGAENASLRQLLAEERLKSDALEQRLQHMTAMQLAQPAVSADQGLREQLSTTLEELQVMAEELSLAQDALRRAGLPA